MIGATSTAGRWVESELNPVLLTSTRLCCLLAETPNAQSPLYWEWVYHPVIFVFSKAAPFPRLCPLSHPLHSFFYRTFNPCSHWKEKRSWKLQWNENAKTPSNLSSIRSNYICANVERLVAISDSPTPQGSQLEGGLLTISEHRPRDSQDWGLDFFSPSTVSVTGWRLSFQSETDVSLLK